jgi:glyoxylase-like metal-dependent hydrolase (beta-lactamase superfamily II)
VSEPWTVRAVRYATRVTPKSALFYDYAVFGEPDVPFRTDYFFWLLSRPGETIVVDVGFGADTAARMDRELVRAPAQALIELGVRADRVVLTHLHWDHTANLDLFPGAELLAPVAELDFWSGPLATHPHFAPHARAQDLETIARARSEGRLTALSADDEVAPGVRSITVGGHAVGQSVLVVETAAGPVILASDAFHFYEEYELRRPFAICADLVGALRAFDVLRELSQDGRHPIVAGHDPLVMERFPRWAGDPAGLTVEVGATPR